MTLTAGKIFILSATLLVGLNAFAAESSTRLSADNLLTAARAYQRIPVKKNGEIVVDKKTGQTITQSRVLRGYMRQNCRDLQNNEFAAYGAEKWAGLPLELCRYHVIDRKDGKSLSKETLVVLLKITDEMLATWTTNTCIEVDKPSLRCVEVISDQIIRQIARTIRRQWDCLRRPICDEHYS